MSIRRAGKDDLEAIVQIYVNNWKSTYAGMLPQEFLEGMTVQNKIEMWTKFAVYDKNLLFIYEGDDGSICGFVALEPESKIENCIYLTSLHTDESYRGQGIGTELIRFAHKAARDAGYSKMSINIVVGNDNAKSLYEKLGAVHYEFFIDDFGGAEARSETLIWNELI